MLLYAQFFIFFRCTCLKVQLVDSGNAHLQITEWWLKYSLKALFLFDAVDISRISFHCMRRLCPSINELANIFLVLT